jgi:hypothetical protein
MIYARIADGRVAELIEIPDDGPPLAERLHPDVAAACVPAGAEVAEGWLWDDAAFAPPPAPEPPQPRRVLRPLAFRRRFAPATRAAITLAAAAALADGDATLQLHLDDLNVAQEIDLDDPETVAAIAALRAADLITEAEQVALLGDATPEEAAR